MMLYNINVSCLELTPLWLRRRVCDLSWPLTQHDAHSYIADLMPCHFRKQDLLLLKHEKQVGTRVFSLLYLTRSFVLSSSGMDINPCSFLLSPSSISWTRYCYWCCLNFHKRKTLWNLIRSKGETLDWLHHNLFTWPPQPQEHSG